MLQIHDKRENLGPPRKIVKVTNKECSGNSYEGRVKIPLPVEYEGHKHAVMIIGESALSVLSSAAFGSSPPLIIQ